MQTRHLFIALAGMVLAAQWLVGPAATPVAASEAISFTCFPHAPSETIFHDTWGAPRSGGRGHRGTDIMSPKGTEVRAVADGVVETLGNGPRSGYYVRLTHEGDWESWYMHLANDTPGTDDGRGGAETAYADGLDEGDRVRAGQVIGYVGDSGNAESSGSHTHFELHVGGRAINPYPYLVDVEARAAALLDRVAGLATLPAPELGESATGGLLGELAEASGTECLPDAFQHAVEHRFVEPPGERVLLARVVAR